METEDYGRINDWMDKIAKKHGNVIKSVTGKEWDTGQAVCVQMFGEGWFHDPRFKEMNALSVLPEEFHAACNELVNTTPEWIKGD